MESMNVFVIQKCSGLLLWDTTTPVLKSSDAIELYASRLWSLILCVDAAYSVPQEFGFSCSGNKLPGCLTNCYSWTGADSQRWIGWYWALYRSAWNSSMMVASERASRIISSSFIDSVPKNMNRWAFIPRNRKRLNPFLMMILWCRKWRGTMLIKFCRMSTYRNLDRIQLFYSQFIGLIALKITWTNCACTFIAPILTHHSYSL